MKVRNIIHKAAVLGSAGVMMGATVMSALAYDLADYPTQFIVDGNFDGKIVVGEKAATSDVLGSVDIAASLQANSVTSEPVEIPGAVGEVSLSGDAFRVETSNDLLELRETLGEVYDTLTDSELDSLRGGSITTDEGSTDYNQYLRFADNANSEALQPMGVNYIEDEDNVLGDFLVIDDGAPFFEWEIEFTEGLEAQVDTSNTPNELSDLEDEVFNIFGTDFTFVNSQINTGSSGVTLEFMAGDVSDTLREGETKTYTIDGVDYEVTAIFISDPNSGTPEAKFAVNGEITDGLQDGDTDTLNNGLQIGVRDLLVNSREGVVEFFLGANKIEFTDSNYASATRDSSGEYAGSVEIANENIEDGSVAIIGQTLSAGAKFEITSIKYRLMADAKAGSTIYVPPGMGVREFLDEPQGMLSPTFDIRYEGLKDVPTADLAIDARSDHSYELTISNIRGKSYDSVPFVTNQASAGNFKWGDDRDDFWFTEPVLNFTGTDGSVANVLNSTTNVNETFWITDDDYFVLSEDALPGGIYSPTSGADEKTDSAIMQYDDIDTSDRVLTFTDMSTGETREVTYTEDTTYTSVLGVANNFVVEGQTYKVWIENQSTGATPWSLAIDLNGDGNITGAEVGFTANGGGVLDLGTQVANVSSLVGSDVVMNLTIPSDQFDDASSTNAESFAWRINVSTQANEVTLNIPSGFWLAPNGDTAATGDEFDDAKVINDDNDDDYDRVMLDYGALVEFYNPSGTNDAEELSITMPDSQVGAQVFIVAGVTERNAGAAGSIQRDVVNPISVGMAVLDSDADGMLGSENLIIVGGPCANSVASEFLGNPANCAEGFEPGKAMISAQEFGDTVAILVAGYEAQETLGASYVLADYATYLADVQGSEVEVVATDLSDLQVSSPASE